MSYRMKNLLTVSLAVIAILGILAAGAAVIGSSINSAPKKPHENVGTVETPSFTLRGKTISFLGDSITTYEGWSNNATYNSTLTANGVKYTSDHFNVNSTWWKQVLNELQLSLCVNNSCDASRVTETKEGVSSGFERCTELHRDNGTQPDIIIVYMGTNDLGNGVPYSDEDGSKELERMFHSSYALMLEAIKETYPNADVFVCTLLPEAREGCTDERLEKFNAWIREMAEYYGADVIDLYADSGITRANYLQYVLNEDPLFVHPNEAGMDLITDAVVKALTEKYR